jgi:hypothetical protein
MVYFLIYLIYIFYKFYYEICLNFCGKKSFKIEAKIFVVSQKDLYKSH